jgi:CsoR family transcriptional regulator, copper-sensing transcriptional repressor
MTKSIPEYKKKTLINLKKANSLLDKIIEMTEDNKYCINLMQQNLAVIGLLKSVNKQLMEGHLNGCFKNAVSTRNSVQQKKMIQEILSVTKLSNK